MTHNYSFPSFIFFFFLILLVHPCKMWKIPKSAAFSVWLLSLAIIADVRGHPLGFNGYPLPELVSDGVEVEGQQSSVLVLSGMEYSSEKCEETYGFLPCSNNMFGQFFLIVVYEYFISHGGSYAASGSEQIFEILGPGVFGASVFQVIGALPECLILLVTVLSASTEAAQNRVSVGMGMLAGSTVILLTIIWGSCVIVGKCDLQDSVAKDSKDTKGFSPTGSGVSTDIWTSYVARIMVLSVIPLIIVQLPQILLHSTSGRRLAALIALVVSLLLLITYFLYQFFQPWIQERRLDFVKHKHVISGLLKHLHALGRLLTEEGEPDEEIIRKLFHMIDANEDGKLSKAELRAFIVGIEFEEIDLDWDEAADKVMRDFDTSNDQSVDEEEFVKGISKWLMEAKRYEASGSDAGPHSSTNLEAFHAETKREHYLVVGDQSDEKVEAVENPKWITFKAVMMMLLGAVIGAAFADPLVDAVDNFSDATRIPTFYISFIALPLATKSREAVAAIILTSSKKMKTASWAFSELYGVVIANNVLCLSVFFFVVYVRGLTWDFPSEVLAIVIVCFVMGAFASFRTTFPLWTSSIALLLYPFSLALVYVLNYVFGWS